MILNKIKVKNFRLLKNFELTLNNELSLVIGKNNCGKTSVISVLSKLLNSSEIFWEDINLDRQKELFEYLLQADATNNTTTTTSNPTISNTWEAANLQLFIEYNDTDTYTNIRKFIMDLNPNNNVIVIEFSVYISENNTKQLIDILNEKDIKEFKYFSKYMSKNFNTFFELAKYSRKYDPCKKDIDENTTENTIESTVEVDNSDIQKVIKIAGVRADRLVSNDNCNHVLSNLASEYFNSYKSAKDKSAKLFNDLEKELDTSDKKFHTLYNGSTENNGEPVKGIFADLIDIVKDYGSLEEKIDISIESSLSEKNLLADNTVLNYSSHGSYSLPETYNGLGYLNLIGILFEVETKINDFISNPAEINLLYIEEPEAHTHPQLQYIFIHNIKTHIAKRTDELRAQNKNLQLLITSHSSHIVSECDFNDIIYFSKKENSVTAKSFKSLIIEYEKDKDNKGKKAFTFVKQYLTLNRSELFFADKVICIEGDTERILIPTMLSKVDKINSKNNSNYKKLLSQNISIMETGAHSHTFMHLFKFLNIKTLIITDIDAATKSGKTYKKSNPNVATCTTNHSIKNFFENDAAFNNATNKFDNLINKEAKDKIHDNIRIAYQIKESNAEEDDGTDAGYQASSFEDAFISLNSDFILKNKDGFLKYGALNEFKDSELKYENYYKFALKKVDKKPAFASCLLYLDCADGDEDSQWKVPRYIREGLEWLQED
ncbi:ATP-dependent nuclease [Gardnerella greenwoodii]|uniref:ATP-dependent endonuclease n=1 Tax=Gardnerella greenwoodii TaxID=2914925 RepID=A0A2N6RYK7_9BIFI|nr:ATP-dependent endonuclease [Gardnerella greenwoodii]MDF0753436.1 ATP-dependent endonuclease [Gardnerella greenwoodii]PMC43158.1 ATP-dependent endonuclease [Gardnerella greenwoodii]